MSRIRIVQDIMSIALATSATSVTLTLDRKDAIELAKDLTWCEKSTERKYSAQVQGGSK